MHETNDARIVVRLPRSMVEELDRLSGAQSADFPDISRSAYIRFALRTHIEHSLAAQRRRDARDRGTRKRRTT